MTIELTDITKKEIEAMKDFVEVEVTDFATLNPIKVRESEFGTSLAARNVIYKIKTHSGKEIYAVDGGFLIDPVTRKFSNTGISQQFKAVYPYVPNGDIADKIHLYFVAKICENERAIPPGGADQLARILGIDPEYFIF